MAFATTPLLLELDPQRPAGNLWKLLVLSAGDGPEFSGQLHGDPPSDETLERVFGPVADTTNPSTGGLAVAPARLMSEVDWRFWAGTPVVNPTHDNCS